MLGKSLANYLSASRIVLTPCYLCFVALSFQQGFIYFLAAAITYCIICVTDLLDGEIARCYQMESELGQKLDILADAIFILSSAAFLTARHLLPIWVDILIFLKLLEFIITSKLLSRNNTPVFDPLGRAVAVLFYILPMWVLLFEDMRFMIALFLAFTLLLSLISTIMRTIHCMRVNYQYSQNL